MAQHVVIVGGGLAGLSAGCYARAAGFRTTVVEHNLWVGGVCTAWTRGRYTVDGCIQWLTGGPFLRLYEELGIVPAVHLRTIERWATWRDGATGRQVDVTRHLDVLARSLCALGPDDAAEIGRLVEGARRFADVTPPGIEVAQELATWSEQFRDLWDLKGSLGVLLHFRKPMGLWANEHLRSATLRRFFTSVVPEDCPVLFFLMVLGYLERGYLSRPVGGTTRFRDALVTSYQRLGGELRLHATVDEILVEDGRARGVRLEDGTILPADAVVCTSSAPETVLRLLGGRFGAQETLDHMKRWKMVPPILLASFGVSAPLADLPQILFLDALPAFEVGGLRSERLYVRICNDDPSLAPSGHAVVQATVPTDYVWWATRGAAYETAKEAAARTVLAQIDRAIPGVWDAVCMIDVATPLTYWHKTRSWRGAYEGWMPNSESFFGHVRKKLPGLEGFYMAGQWVEPGGGVPTAVMSGRQAAQLLCADHGRRFVSDPSKAPVSVEA
jgi:phytoene desaturase